MRLLATVALFIVLSPAVSAAAPLAIGDLQGEDCSHVDAQTQEEVTGYWRRHPPLVGYRKGERLLAGGDGTCVLGFPVSEDNRALILVDGAKMPVFLTADHANVKTFVSRDGSVRVELSITGTDTTCEPGEDKCCGDYTYATIVVSKGKRHRSVRAVTYVGG